MPHKLTAVFFAVAIASLSFGGVGGGYTGDGYVSAQYLCQENPAECKR